MLLKLFGKQDIFIKPFITTKENFDFFCLFLGALAKLRKWAVSFVISVRPSVRMKQLSFHCTNFHEIFELGIFRNYFENIHVLLKSDKNKGEFT
jgi:hypothetical protein